MRVYLVTINLVENQKGATFSMKVCIIELCAQVRTPAYVVEQPNYGYFIDVGFFFFLNRQSF